MITVFYDGKCGLCAKEINHYRNIAPNGVFNWQDINLLNDVLSQEGFTLEEGLKLLHAKDENGTLHIGVNAFLLIWRHLKRWQILAFFVSLPVFKQLADFTYHRFANWRFRRHNHCVITQPNK